MTSDPRDVLRTAATRLLLAAAYVGTIFAANALTAHFGMAWAGPGLVALAGTYSAGLALGLRDALHEAAGVRWVLASIVAGAAASAVVSPSLALASAVAFGLAELLDLAVYAPLRSRGFRRAVIASNVVGAVADTLLFLWLAGFPITGPAVAGQLVVKAVFCTAAVLAVREVARRVVPGEPQHTKGT